MYIASYRHLEAPINICRWKMALTAFFLLNHPLPQLRIKKFWGFPPSLDHHLPHADGSHMSQPSGNE